MGVRGLIYFAQMYNTYMEKHNLNRFGSKLIQLPVPKFVVFFNGTSWNEEEVEIRLSDCFSKEGGEPCVEVIARMVNINYGKNKELMEHCKPLRDYAIFVNKVRRYSQEMELKEAINKAIDECIEEDCLKDFLVKSRAEVLEFMIDSYSLENYQKIVEYEKNELEGKINALQTSCAELRTENNEVKAENDEVKAENAEVKAENAEVKAENAEVKAENAEVKAKNTELKNENAKLQEIIDKMQEQLQEMRKEQK
jgi:hypothetical protein